MTDSTPQTLNRDWLTTEQASAYLQVSTRTLFRYLEEGKIRGKQLSSGGHWRISAASLERFLDGSQEIAQKLRKTEKK
jgi:excisionase family DNA binding protein